MVLVVHLKFLMFPTLLAIWSCSFVDDLLKEAQSYFEPVDTVPAIKGHLVTKDKIELGRLENAPAANPISFQ